MSEENEKEVVESAIKEKPKSFNEALKGFASQITDEDESAMILADEAKREEESAAKKNGKVEAAEADEEPTGGVPPWAQIPDGLKIPARKVLVFVRFRAEWTDKPELGDRHCVLWNLTDSDEKLAQKRIRGEPGRVLAELTLQTIRAFDGERVDWTKGAAANVYKFWSEIGGKCRNALTSLYSKNHNLNREEQIDFFKSCVVYVTATPSST